MRGRTTFSHVLRSSKVVVLLNGNVRFNQRYSTELRAGRQVENGSTDDDYDESELGIVATWRASGLIQRGRKAAFRAGHCGTAAPQPVGSGLNGSPAKGTVIQQPFFRRQH